MTRHHQGFTRIRPSGLPLRLWLLDGTGTLGLDHLGSARRSYPHRTPGWGRALEHWPGSTPSTSVEPPNGEFTRLERHRVARSRCTRRRPSPAPFPPVQLTMRVERPAPCTAWRPRCCWSSVCGRSVQVAPVAGSTMPQRQCGLFSSGGRPRSQSPSVSRGVVMSVHVRQVFGWSVLPSPDTPSRATTAAVRSRGAARRTL
jgi:hypothetical protein